MHLAKPILPAVEPEAGDDPAETTNEPTNEPPPVKPDDDIRCVHHKLNPKQAKKMKRIKRVSV